MGKKAIAVIFGGVSSEHEISLKSAATILANLDEDRYLILPVYITKDGRWLLYDGPKDNLKIASLEKFGTPAVLSPDTSHRGLLRMVGDKFKLINVDAVFPILHGKNGEDGTIQGLFEIAGIPYVGSGVLGSSVGMCKAFTNMIAEEIGVAQIGFLTVTRSEMDNNMEGVLKNIRYKIGYPCFVKPSNAGSSVGISMAKNKKELEGALAEAVIHDDLLVVEKRAVGRELECSVIGNEGAIASGVGEITYEREFYCYDAKYGCEGSKTLVPADVPAEVVAKIQEISLKIFHGLNCKGLARVDFFLTEKGEVLFNEINTMPGFTNISMYPMLWHERGMTTPDIVDRLIELALEGRDGG
ncbi:MAG: D-alanine--D-alanine ligase [Defluviitaleaceae bacterium]|nr:D-alanine--D-alanine ligase [Defluviitaleaceae bacterium]